MRATRPRRAMLSLGAMAVLLAVFAIKVLVDLREDEPSVSRAAPLDAMPAHARSPNVPLVEPAPAPDAAATVVADPPDRTAMFAKLRASGAHKAPWNDPALKLLDSLRGDFVTPDGFYEVGIPLEGCYAAGCMALFSFDSRAALLRAQEAVERSDWTGRREWSRPDEREGKLQVMLVLYAPD